MSNEPGVVDASIISMLRSIRRNRTLIIQMIRREVSGRYKGSWLGLAWSFVNPVIMLAIYTFFFSVIFKARWGTDGGQGKGSFAIFLFAGLILHGLVAECVNRGPTLIIGNVNYVKRVIFPLEVLPVVAMGAALFHAFVSVLVLLVAQLLLGHGIHWTILFLPLVVLPLVLTATGVAWWLASLGVFMRDVGQIVGFAMTVLLFLSPVFYPVSAMPEQYQVLLMLNPLTFIIEQARAVLITGDMPDFFRLTIATWVGLVVAWLGFWWFQSTRKGFADVL